MPLVRCRAWIALAVAGFEESCDAVEQARQQCETAETVFRQHVTTHGCWDYDPGVPVDSGTAPGE